MQPSKQSYNIFITAPSKKPCSQESTPCTVVNPAVLTPQNECTCWEGLPVSNWAPIYKQSPAAIAKRGSSTQATLPGEACNKFPACTVFLPTEPTLLRSSWNCILTNRTEIFPTQLELCSYSLIRIYADQSEQLHSTSAFWANQTVKIWSPYLHEDGTNRVQGLGLHSV